jgi:hypothetical protein
LCAKWADLVSEEFFQQGDNEKSLGLEISPMCDRTKTNLRTMQMGFIEFAVAPLIISEFFPSKIRNDIDNSLIYSVRENISTIA